MTEQGQRPASGPPGWYPDPAGTGGWRFFDGVNWTATAGGDTPPTAPPMPTPSPSELAADAVRFVKANPWVTAGLRAGLRNRPATGLESVLAAVAGGLVALGALLIAGNGRNPSEWAGFGISVAVAALGIGGALALGAAIVRSRWPLGPLVAGCTVMGLAGSAGAVIFFASAISGSSTSSALLWWPYAVLAGVLLVLWLLPGLQGRPALLGGALLSGSWAVVALYAVTSSSRAFRYWSSSASNFGAATPSGDVVTDVVTKASLLAVGIGAVLVVASLAADHFGLRGISTPLVFAGAVAASAGAFGVASDGGFVQVAAVAAVGVLILAVGAIAARKATLWFGGGILGVGVVAAIQALLDPGRNETAGVGVLVLGAAVVIAVAALAVALWGAPAVARYRSGRALATESSVAV